jgi:uncharacterized membrane protein
VSLGELHPFIIHFTVALLLVAATCDMLGLLLRRETLLQAGRWNTLIGAGFAILGALSGFAAEKSLGGHSSAGAALLELHRGLGIVIAIVWVPVGAWRAGSKMALPLRLRTLYLTAAFTGAALVLVESVLGTALVYRHGVGLSESARAVPMAQPHQKIKADKK